MTFEKKKTLIIILQCFKNAAYKVILSYLHCVQCCLFSLNRYYSHAANDPLYQTLIFEAEYSLHRCNNWLSRMNMATITALTAKHFYPWVLFKFWKWMYLWTKKWRKQKKILVITFKASSLEINYRATSKT